MTSQSPLSNQEELGDPSTIAKKVEESCGLLSGS